MISLYAKLIEVYGLTCKIVKLLRVPLNFWWTVHVCVWVYWVYQLTIQKWVCAVRMWRGGPGGWRRCWYRPLLSSSTAKEAADETPTVKTVSWQFLVFRQIISLGLDTSIVWACIIHIDRTQTFFLKRFSLLSMLPSLFLPPPKITTLSSSYNIAGLPLALSYQQVHVMADRVHQDMPKHTPTWGPPLYWLAGQSGPAWAVCWRRVLSWSSWEGPGPAGSG